MKAATATEEPVPVVARSSKRREKALLVGLFVVVTVPLLSNNLVTLEPFTKSTLFKQAVPLLSSSSPLSASSTSSSSSPSSSSPPPHVLKWPQKDDRIRKTIQNGIRINVNQTGEYYDDSTTNKREFYVWNGTRYEAPPRQLSTVVSAYYDMPSKHPTHSYQAWFHWMLQATDPMVIFIDPNTKWLEFVKERRKHAPTIIAPLAFANLTMATTFSDDFWKNEVFPSDKGKRFKKGIDVYKIWNEKMIFMHEVAELNPFSTDQFLWIDAGYYRSKASAPIAQPIVRNNLTQNGLASSEQVVLQHVGASTSRYELAGGAWGGRRAAIAHMYTCYFETFWWMVTQRISCIGYEQRIFTVMCKSFPSLCSIHRIDDWFGMGRSWFRNPMQSFANPEQEDMPGFRFHRVVQSPVIFPTADVIHSVYAA